MLLIFIMACFSTYSYYANRTMQEKSEELVEQQLEMLTANQNLATSISVRVQASMNYVLTGDKSYLEMFHEYVKFAEANNSILDELDKSPERAKIVGKARQWTKNVIEEAFIAYENGDQNQAVLILIDNNLLANEVRVGYETLANERAETIKKLGQDVVATSTSTKTVGLVISALVLIVGVITAFITASSIAKPIELISNRMKAMADGQLNLEKLNVNRQDEIGILTNSANEMNEKLRATITSIHEVSEHVASNSEELAQSATEVKLGSEQIASTMQEIASGTETQASASSDLASTMMDFVATIQQTTSEGMVLKEHSVNVQSLTSAGKELMNSSTEQMHAIDSIVQDAVEKVEGLNEQSKEINQLVSVIDSIANQTNLLALNAAIEAARAGEHGKGFAVVADEVRKLAEQVQFSVTDISTIVGRIQRDTSNVTSSLQSGYEEVKKGTAQITYTGTTFEQISTAVENMTTNIDRISTNLQEIVVKTDSINHSIDEVASVSEESAAGVEQTTATIQQTSSTMEEIASSADQLASMAEQLNIQIQQFKL
ncbi:methyl-accepting chemotaxis protein [Solibacillus sp. FSL H8-0538]|uniref:methyl-accepting chemotaxis protein n=1 Tax=Solibacillus sp. FSL H8-0538 TaxID=2921400 RepID=UPI0030F4C6EA